MITGCRIRLLVPLAFCLVSRVIPIASARAETPGSNLSIGLNQSFLSDKTILSELSATREQRFGASLGTEKDRRATITSSEAGNFHFNSGANQSAATRIVSEAVRNALEIEDQQKKEIAAHPFWNAKFWTQSPVAILGLLGGGDRHRLETPPTEREKLSLTDYQYDSAIRKFERTISFGSP